MVKLKALYGVLERAGISGKKFSSFVTRKRRMAGVRV